MPIVLYLSFCKAILEAVFFAVFVRIKAASHFYLEKSAPVQAFAHDHRRPARRFFRFASSRTTTRVTAAAAAVDPSEMPSSHSTRLLGFTALAASSSTHYYFVPYGQDDPIAKPSSLKADFARLPAALDAALAGRQLQPVLLQNNV